MDFPWENDPEIWSGFHQKDVNWDALGSVKTHHFSSMNGVLFGHQGNRDVFFFFICEHDKHFLKTRSSINTWGLNQPLAGRTFI